ncbi:MAG: pseudoazurin [Gammaproteobacteria bacterium]|nr:pseudoazurin [Gammaproteobacteria bacterium]|tara:strand:- start:1983 stop:2423 length:441 start_codon:yes stop_codon:yes gene_type:complete
MRLLICTFFLLFTATSAFAGDATVEMLNKSGSKKNVFSSEIVYVDVGDTVFWKSASKGHNVEFISKRGVPEGVGKFKSKVSKDAQFTFEVPGIYAYWCTPHKAMGMIGFVVVGGNTDNIESIKKVKWVGKKSKKIAKELISKIEAG